MQFAAAYIRVSTDDQIEYSPDSQLKKIREYAEHNNMVLLEEHVYIDEGISGKNTKNRPQFNRMIANAKTKPKPFDCILLWKFSRFARNREDSIVYKSMLRRQCGINVISISESLGDDKTSILIEALIEAMDEYYSINLAEEVKRGMTEKASRGEPVCAGAFGYCLKDGVYVPDENADTVRRIFREYVAGEPMSRIARRLGNEGVRTKRGNRPDNRFIDYILHNPVYIGKIRWNPTGKTASMRDYDNPDYIISEGKHTPLVEKEVFQAAAERMQMEKARYAKYQRHEPVKNDFMLRGLVRCGDCGATLVMMSLKKPTIQCHNYSRGQCPVSHSITLEKLDQSVISALRTCAATGNYTVDVTDATATPLSDDNARLLQNERNKLARCKEAYINGIDSLEEYKANKAAITRKIAVLETKQNEAKNRTIDKEAYTARILEVIDTVTSPNVAESSKNKALHSILSKIVFNKPGNDIDLYFHA